MNKFSKFFLIFAGMSFVLASCTKDLDTVPIDKDVVTSAGI